MNLLVMGAVLLGGILLESFLPASVALGLAKTPILLSIVIYYALNRTLFLTLTAALVGGILSDSVSGLPLGCSAFCFCAIGALVRMYRLVQFSGKWVTLMFLGAVAGMGMALTEYVMLLAGAAEFGPVLFAWVAAKIIGSGVLGLVAAPVVYAVMEWLDRMTGNLQEEAPA